MNYRLSHMLPISSRGGSRFGADQTDLASEMPTVVPVRMYPGRSPTALGIYRMKNYEETKNENPDSEFPESPSQ